MGWLAKAGHRGALPSPAQNARGAFGLTKPAVAFIVMDQRVATGNWPATDFAQLRALAAVVASASPVDSGPSNLFDPGSLPPRGTSGT